MTSFKTPGVYIQEIDTFPPGVAAVETAIPAFIGYTQKAEKDGAPLITVDNGTTIITPVRIKSMIDFEAFFGKGADVSKISVTLSDDPALKVNAIEVTPGFQLYHSMKLFFDNGGGDCFIAAVGLHKQNDGTNTIMGFDDFEAGLTAIGKVDEPTLLVAPDAVNLEAGQRQNLQQQMLKQAGELKDRFAILDVAHNANKKRFEITEVDNFRNAIGATYLDYGAAYYPYLRTNYSLGFQFDDIKLKKGNGAEEGFATYSNDAAFMAEVENIFSDIDTASSISKLIQAPYDNGFTAPFNGATNATAKYKVGLSTGYGLIERTNNKVELELRTQYIKEMLAAFIQLNDHADFNDVSSQASRSKVSPDSRSAFELHGEKIKPTGDLNTLINQLLVLDAAYPGAVIGEFAAGAELNYTNDQGTDIDYTAIAAVVDDDVRTTYYGDPADANITEAERVARVRPFFQQLYSDVLNQIVDFHEQLKRRAESLEKFLIDNDEFYKRIHSAIRRHGVVLPPSGAIAGLYARIDNNKGVWKAPANESVSAVVGPTVHIDNNDQKDVNVDVNAGKSVNAIRAFRGKGIIVWGGRTLKGNDDNWRYVSVRRLFIFMEESIEKAMENFVFEPNTANTWVKAQTTIENFLNTVWRQGGLAGAKPEDAFRVSIGLGKTMSADDINKGLMIIDVQVAPSRPAEFILLRFSQMQQSS